MDVTCIICEDNFDPSNGKMIATPCGHVFHQVCANQWFEKQENAVKTCPTCRDVVDVREIIEIQLNSDEGQIQSNIAGLFAEQDELTAIYMANKVKLEAAYRAMEEKSKVKRKVKVDAAPAVETVEISDDSPAPPPQKRVRRVRIISSSDDEI